MNEKKNLQEKRNKLLFVKLMYRKGIVSFSEYVCRVAELVYDLTPEEKTAVSAGICDDILA
jgi:hypothetical protein